MKNKKRRGKKWQVLALLLIAVAWFFRDYLASNMDTHVREVQQVLTERDSQLRSQEQGKDLRDIMITVTGIESELSNVNKEQVDNDLNDFYETQGTALGKSAEDFGKLLKPIDLKEDEKAKLEQVVTDARKVAAGLKAGPVNDELIKEWGQAEEGLSAGYERLAQEASNDLDSSGSAASLARFIAWICTALGVVVLGDWKKLFGMFGGGQDDDDADSGEGAEAALE